jgi:hypothetical protein
MTYNKNERPNIRDYFAAKAVAAILTSDKVFTADSGASTPITNWADYAKGAYQLADAMLAERSKENAK